MTRLLPAGFEALEPFVAQWCAADPQARFERRYAADMAEIRRFYDAMQPMAEPALRLLDTHRLHDLHDDARRLYQLLMALAHAAIAVERHGQPRAANTSYPTTLRILCVPLPA